MGQRNGNGAAPPGARTLVLLATAPNVAILRALALQPTRAAELGDATGRPGEGAPRAQLRLLVSVGALGKRRLNSFPGVLEYELTPAGHELLEVAGALEGWLGEAPDGPQSLGDDAAFSSVKTLAEGWSAGVVGGLAAGHLTLAELAGENPGISYPTLEHRLAAMRRIGLVWLCRESGNDRRNTTGDWLHAAAAPLLAAFEWERRHAAEAPAALRQLDREAIDLLAAPR